MAEKTPFPELPKKLREQEPREPPSPGQAQMRFPPTPSTPGGARRKPEVYQTEKAQGQNTLLPSREDKAEGAGKSKERSSACTASGRHGIEEGWRVRIWVEHEKANILTGL